MSARAMSGHPGSAPPPADPPVVGVGSAERFASEEDLVHRWEMALALPRQRHNQRVVVAREVRLGAGQVDLVVGMADQEALSHRLRAGRPLLSAQEIVVLTSLDSKAPRSLSELQTSTGLPRVGLECAVDKLLALQLMTKDQDYGYLRAAVAGEPCFSEIICVEAKLSKWQDVLRQASRNRHYCTQSYALLDAGSRRVVQRSLEEFRRREVGVLMIDARTGVGETLLSAPRRQPDSTLLWWTASETLLSELGAEQADYRP